jgi:signal transduction histidine kinase
MPSGKRVPADDPVEALRECAAVAREERRRIRRTLHDSIGQQVTALLFGLSRLDRYRYLFSEQLSELREIAGALKKETTLLVQSLNPAEYEEWGMLAVLRPKIEQWAAAHAFHFHSTGLGGAELEAGTEVVLYTLVRSALVHSMRTPGTNRIDLAVERRADHLLAVLEDDGSDSGDPEAQEIIQLACALSAEAEIESSPSGGTLLTFRIPF